MLILPASRPMRSRRVSVSNCDGDSREIDKFADAAQKELGYSPEKQKNFRKILKDKDADAITLATLKHRQVPIATRELQAGKHVYVEKPCSHNPH